MKSIRLLLLFGTIATLVGRTDAAAAGAVTRRGPDLLQFTTRNRIGGNEFGPNTAGTLQMQYTERGETVRQSLQLNASGLESNSVVSITAAMGDSADVITAAHVPTDRRGRIRATYLTRVPAPNGISRIEPVPELLSPLTDVRAICVENSSGVVIGAGSIADADTFQYVVRRNLTPVDPNGTAAGSITLVANQRRVNFTLLAGGLVPSVDYFLVVNSTAVGQVTSSKAGRVLIRGWPAEAPRILDVRSITLADANANPVLTTSLPR